jgi:DNA-binding MarR family transcriptional regulator
MSTPYDTASLESVLADERITVTGLLFEVEAALLRRLDTELRAQVGMSAAFFEVLVRLGRSPRGRMRLTDLARQLSITTGGVTRLIDRIQEAGFIRRIADPEDRRSVFAEITPAGAAALRPAVTCQLESIQRYLVDPLDEKDYLALATSLRLLRDALIGDPGQNSRHRRGAPNSGRNAPATEPT